MKRVTVSIFIFVFVAVFVLASAEEKKKDDPWKDIHVVEKAEPVPERMKEGFDSISGKDAEAYLRFLASDLLEGRDTASKSYEIAAQYAASLLRLWGVQPAGDLDGKGKERSYFQEVVLKEVLENEGVITIQRSSGPLRTSRTFTRDIDYRYRPEQTGETAAPLVFVGYGISDKGLKFDEYKGLDVKGKAVIVFTDTPWQDKKRQREWDLLVRKSETAIEKGAVALLRVDASSDRADIPERRLRSEKVNDEEPIIPRKIRRLSLLQAPRKKSWQDIPIISISREMANFILGFSGSELADLKREIDRDLKPRARQLPGVSIAIKGKVTFRLTSSTNVLGMIEGSDPELKKEVVMVGAHLDHMGKSGDYIFNGADDNGSGCVGVLEIAQAFVTNPKKPKRSIAFALWTGEERGLLGSEYYVSNPCFPLQETVAYLNMDMIGRVWDKERLEKLNKSWELGISEEVFEKVDVEKFLMPRLGQENRELYEAVKESNRWMGLMLFLRKTEKARSGSDHYYFAQEKIPWMHIFSAVSEDFHKPSDSVEKISFDMIRRVARLVYLTAFSLADEQGENQNNYRRQTMSAPGKACEFLSVKVRYGQSLTNSLSPMLHLWR